MKQVTIYSKTVEEICQNEFQAFPMQASLIMKSISEKKQVYETCVKLWPDQSQPWKINKANAATSVTHAPLDQSAASTKASAG
ncbi:hypothetical protein HUJ04_004761 [Dendroctonus ponderosae]|nr:hypothetical protein HUJ04_004761 [Dendroctonus ponderosae]